MNVKKLLVHCCCCHCAAYTLQFFRQQVRELSAFWYNPNIHPYLEHTARYQALVTLTGIYGFPLITLEGYELEDFFRRITGREDRRCLQCYELRLTRTADEALARGFDAFSSSLLISPWQQHDAIRTIGETIARNRGIPFLYVDLRKHYADSRRLTKPLDLYRQQYCGCLYSEWERYRNSPPPGAAGNRENDNLLNG